MMAAALIALLVLAFLLSGMEGALLSVSRLRARHAADEGDARAGKLARLLEKRDEILHAVTLSGHLAALLAFCLIAVKLVAAWGAWGWAAAVLVLLPLFFAALEVVPKHLFRRHAFRVLRLLTGLLALLHLLFQPWLWMSRLWTPPLSAASDAKQHGLGNLVETITSLQLLPSGTEDMLLRFERFQKKSAADLMMPLRQVTALPPDMPLASALVLAKEQKHAWRTVLNPDGRLLGWLDATALPPKIPSDKMVRQFMRPLTTLPSTEPAFRCLQTLRKRGEPLAAVQDKKGETIGVITQHALLENIFGTR